MEECCLAVDVGGTKMAAAVVTRAGQLLASRRCPTPSEEDGEVVFSALASVVNPLLAEFADRLVVCGVGCGGPMAPGGVDVSPLNIAGWRRFPLRHRLAALTGLSVSIDNDAKALALAEGWRGAARGVANYLAMVVSTGIGAGIVLDGRLLDGRLGNAGHIGHVVVVPDGRRCVCGGQGCLEAEASGLAIAAITGRPAADAPPSVVERAGRLTGRAVASVANLLDLDLALVSGSVALGFGAPFFSAAQEEIVGRAGLSFSAGTVIKPAGLAADGPLLGAAAVGWRRVDGG